MKKLEELLKKSDHRSYPAYKSLKGRYHFPEFDLSIDHVQGDPFASPSSVSVHVSAKTAGFPAWMYQKKYLRIALQDYLLRAMYRETGHYSHKTKGSGKSGLLAVSRCGQEILERSGCTIDPENGRVTVRMQVGFPAAGRTTLAGELRKILMDYIPACVKKALLYRNLNHKKLSDWMKTAENQHLIRCQMKDQDLIAFVADDACLPRTSGVHDTPMRDAVLFQSPASMSVKMKLEDGSVLNGMGIHKGVTLVVGGGYHGKSTLLSALERGVYNHIPGDGREYVLTDPTAMKLRAEDGRSVCHVDISPFISNLPNHKNTGDFSTPDASGSTSQAANTIEAILSGSQTLLIDEDTSATNFMVRDALMQKVVLREKEPIIPFVDRIRELYDDLGISTVLVAGSSGAFFLKADTILQMDEYRPFDITEKAKKEAREFLDKASSDIHRPDPMTVPQDRRIPQPDKSLRQNRKVKIRGNGTDGFSINRENVELRYLEQLTDAEQVNTLGKILYFMETEVFDGKKKMSDCVDEVCRRLEKAGFSSVLSGRMPGNLAMPRRQEIYAMLNRYRSLQVKV